MYRLTLALSLCLLFSPPGWAAERWYRSEHARAGAALFQQHCAACHGKQAEGAANWQRPNPDGRYPPPPLNGTAHTWHHPLQNLYTTIMQGQGNMPAWQGKLNRGEVLAIIAWFQSQWPEQIYSAWERMDRSAQQ